MSNELKYEDFQLGVYKHTKSGRLYHCYDMQLDSEDVSITRISYQALYADRKKFSRPAKMFGQVIEIQGKDAQRFQYLCSLDDYLVNAAQNW